MRILDVCRSIMARISVGLPMKWMKKSSALLVLILFGLLLGYGSAAGETDTGYIGLVTRLEVDRLGIGPFSSVTSDPTAGTLLLLDGGKNQVHTISTFGELLATEKLEGALSGGQHIEYDARSGSLLMFDPSRQQIQAASGEKGTAVTLPLTAVNGIASDPISGDVYLLDSSSGQFIRVPASGIGLPDPASPPKAAPVSTIALGGETGDLRGLAYDPTTRHLFSIHAKRQQLVEFTLTGDQVKVYDLSPFSLPEPEALAFAPSTDQTDAPSVTSLYIAAGEIKGDVWEFTFTPEVAFTMSATAATLVQTINVWQFSPPSPDGSGATFLPHSGRLLETDSEVNEKAIYQDANQFEMTLSGSLINTYDTTHFTNEPTGIAYDPDRNHLFITDDDDKKVYESDLNYNMVNSFSVSSLDGKGVDPEGAAYNSWNGRLYIAGGTSNTIFWIDPGSDHDFGTSDDSEGSFPATNLNDPEGITFNTDNGHIYAVGRGDVVAEYTAAGSVVQMIDISAANADKPAGMAYGPTSVGGGKSIYVTDRGVDADSGINGGNGDGRIYEFALGAIGPPPAPTAGFTGTPTSGPVALTVDFSNSSSGSYDTCSWDFGDSNSSSACNNPSHTYNSVGSYDVALTVTGPGGSDTKSEVAYIRVVEPAVAAFSATPTESSAPQTVAFSNSSGGAYDTCNWDFGDGGSSSDCADPSHEYSIGGVFTVSLTVSGTGGSSTETKSGYITIHQAPAVAFSASPTGGPAPLTVDFSNLTSGDFDTCAWSFGDSNSSPDCNDPSHTYNSAGTYAVTLAVDGSWGADSLTKSGYISVYEPAVAVFSASPTEGVAPELVTFSNHSSGDFDSCSWDFGDGGSSSSCNGSVNHTYNSSGVFEVTLTVSGNGGTNSETKPSYITMHQAPAAAFNGTPSSGPAPLVVNFSNLSTGDYDDTCAWNFGDPTGSNNIILNCSKQTHLYNNPGTYSVELAVGASWGTDTLAKTNYIQVGVPAVAAFSGNPTTGIAPQQVTFSNASSGDYATCAWNFGDGGTSSSCAASVNHTYSAAGVFPVSLTVSGIGGENTKTELGYITIYQPPTADFSALPTVGPAPHLVQFTNLSNGDYDSCTWNFGDGGSSNMCVNPSHEYATPGTYEVSLTVSGLGGEATTSKASYIVTGAPVTADFSGGPTGGNAPLQVTFTNLATGDYDTCLWEFGDSTTSSVCANPQHSYTVAGNYTVSLLISGAGGSQTATKVDYIMVSEAGNANFSADPQQGTAPLVVNFSNLSLGDFDACQWDFGDGSTLQSCGDPAHTYTAPGTYSVTLAIDGLGGPDSVTFSNLIAVYEAAVADFDADPKAGTGPLTVNFSNLSSGDYLTCTWDFGDGGSSSNCENPSHIYAAAGVYTVTLRVEGPGGIGSKTAVAYINVEDETASFSATPRTGPVPLLVSFDNLSSGNYDSCLWRFGDGETSSECDNPSHIYTAPGSYTVELSMSGPSGSESMKKIDYISAEPNLISLPLILHN